MPRGGCSGIDQSGDTLTYRFDIGPQDRTLFGALMEVERRGKSIDAGRTSPVRTFMWVSDE
jgi:hypothetical protein